MGYDHFFCVASVFLSIMSYEFFEIALKDMKNNKVKSSYLSGQDKYHLNKDLTSELISHIRSHFPNLQGIRSRGANPLHEYAKVYNSRKGPIEDNESFFTMLGYENLLYKDGIPTIFPQSINLIEQLYKAKFSSPDKIVINPPFRNFAIAMPKGIKVAGFDMPGFTVITGSRYEIYDVNNAHALSTIYPDKISVEEVLENSFYDKDDDEKMVVIKLKSPVTNTHIYESINMDVFHLLLQSKNLREFHQLQSEYLKKTEQEINKESRLSKLQNINQIEANDLLIYSAFKMYATMCIYLSCSKNAKMVDGIPSQYSKQVRQNDSLLRSNNNYFVESTPEIEMFAEQKGEVSTHYRGMHFRNLQHPKYYQGEYKGMEQGSRWTEVSGCIVGMNVTPKTIINEEFGM